MKIFIDFDDVIFNSKLFKDDLINIFSFFGVSERMFKETYYDPDDSRTIRTYDPMKQIMRLNRRVKLDDKGLIEALDSFLDDTSKYVFDDVIPFCVLFGRENIRVVSYGNHGFQKRKIGGSKISAYCSDFVLTEKLKSEAVADIMENVLTKNEHGIVFIDDRNEQIRDVKERFPEIITVFLQRPEGRYQEMEKDQWCDYHAHDLEEAGNIIKEICKY